MGKVARRDLSYQYCQCLIDSICWSDPPSTVLLSTAWLSLATDMNMIILCLLLNDVIQLHLQINSILFNFHTSSSAFAHSISPLTGIFWSSPICEPYQLNLDVIILHWSFFFIVVNTVLVVTPNSIFLFPYFFSLF